MECVIASTEDPENWQDLDLSPKIMGCIPNVSILFNFVSPMIPTVRTEPVASPISTPVEVKCQGQGRGGINGNINIPGAGGVTLLCKSIAP